MKPWASEPDGGFQVLVGLLLLAVLAWTAPSARRLFPSALLNVQDPVIRRSSDAGGLVWSPLAPVSGHGPSPRADLPEGWQGMLLGRPLDLNRAEAVDLEALPGVGPKTAAAILADRSARGSFKRVDDLVRVAGIGPKTLERLRPYLCTIP